VKNLHEPFCETPPPIKEKQQQETLFRIKVMIDCVVLSSPTRLEEFRTVVLGVLNGRICLKLWVGSEIRRNEPSLLMVELGVLFFFSK